MTSVLLTTRLKVSDPAAMTALATLRDRMGLDGVLAGLSRSELFFMDVDVEGEAARELVERLVRRTNLFLNPNKHLWTIQVDGDAVSRRPASGPPEQWLLVRALSDPRDFLESLWRHAGAREITAVYRAWAWRFTAREGVSAGDLREAAERASVVTTRGRGFLVHPAFQEGTLYAEAPNLYDMRSLVSTTLSEGLPAQ